MTVKTTTKTKQLPLVVTTEHKGVFFGYGVPTNGDTIRIEKAQMCVFWSTDVQGVVGLAAKGPNKNCKIGPEAPAITLRDVTAVMECSDEAAKAWKTAGERKWG